MLVLLLCGATNLLCTCIFISLSVCLSVCLSINHLPRGRLLALVGGGGRVGRERLLEPRPLPLAVSGTGKEEAGGGEEDFCRGGGRAGRDGESGVWFKCSRGGLPGRGGVLYVFLLPLSWE